VDAQLFLLDVPVDHHAVAAVAGVELDLAGSPERGLGLAVLAGSDELHDPHLGSREDWYRKPV
jgi:hypothetical protein